MRLRWAACLVDGPMIGGDEHERVTAASIIKLPVLLAFLRAVDAGSLDLAEVIAVERRHRVGGSGWLTDSGLRELDAGTLARAMIDTSDNAATNVLVDRVGLPAIAAAAESAGLSGTIMQRHLMDLVARAAGLENLVTAADAVLAVIAAVRGPLLSPASHDFALDALLAQKTTGRLTECVPDGLRLAHKTGELDGVRHDVAVLLRDRTPVAALGVLGTCDAGDEDALDAAIVGRGRALCRQLGLA